MNGILIVNKSKGVTSRRVVDRLRKLTGIKKVGHAGTLDPLAEGILPICLGRATKIAQYITAGKKEYKLQLKLGIVTDTLDCLGKILEENLVEGVTSEKVSETLRSFVGCHAQVPPMFSAIKVGGQRLYKLARQGIKVSVEPHKVYIYRISLVSFDCPYIKLSIECSKGTYIRALTRDIGTALGCGATLTELTRVRVGRFTLDNAYTIATVEEKIASGALADIVMPLKSFITDLPVIYLGDVLLAKVKKGMTVPLESMTFQQEKVVDVDVDYNICDSRDEIVAIGRISYGDKYPVVKPKRVIAL